MRTLTPAHKSQYDRIGDYIFKKSAKARQVFNDKPKANRDDRSILLPQLEMSEYVAFQNPISRELNTTVIIESVRKNCECYIVQETNEGTYLRSLRFLKKRIQNLETKLDEVSDCEAHELRRGQRKAQTPHRFRT
uniref:Uncharacterized protein n=1 Tax=Lepeophtheirus salmonis TaxID=72036 RepID=A0A0K2TIL1_LEPSM